MFLTALRAQRPAVAQDHDDRDLIRLTIIPRLQDRLAQLDGVEHIRIVPGPSWLDIAIFFTATSRDDWEPATSVPDTVLRAAQDLLPDWEISTR